MVVRVAPVSSTSCTGARPFILAMTMMERPGANAMRVTPSVTVAAPGPVGVGGGSTAPTARARLR
jgi:hypothetical protein